MPESNAPHVVETAMVDIVGRCNLGCIYCNEGVRANLQPQTTLGLDEFRERYSGLLRDLRHLDLHNWSEPFLNLEFFDIVDFALDENPELEIAVSTNGHALTEAVCERLVEGKVRDLTISISGLTNEVYRIYHVGGDLEKVLAGLERLLAAKERTGAALPRVRLRYLRFPFNFISRGTLRRFLRRRLGRLYRQLRSATVRDGYVAMVRDEDLLRYLQAATGRDDLRELLGKGRSAEEVFEEATGHALVTVPYAPKCTMIHESVTIRTHGTVFPCCIVPYEDRYAMGRMGEQSLSEIRDGPKYRSFRERFDAGTNSVCNRCRLGYPVPRWKWDRHLLPRAWRILRLRRLGSR